MKGKGEEKRREKRNGLIKWLAVWLIVVVEYMGGEEEEEDEEQVISLLIDFGLKQEIPISTS